MPKDFGSGALFQSESHEIFMRITISRYNAMCDRLEKKKLRPLEFSATQLRAALLEAMNGKEDGFLQCRYCRGYFTLKDIAFDHAIPLNRGGSTSLENIEYPCKSCNDAKGQMTPTEYLKLLEFLERELPLARVDVISRLQKAIALASGSFAIQATINELKRTGEWEKASRVVRARQKAKQAPASDF
jgi:HNH endonuclease